MMLEERRAKPNKVKNDFFDYVLEELKQDDTFLTEPIGLDFMFALLYANFETTSQAIIVAIKLLTDNPRALKELTYLILEEHEKLLRKRKTNIHVPDYTIPSGWVIVVCPPAVHLDPINYKDPLNFDPWRWEGRDFKGASRTFMAFGGGLRFCVGAEFARLQMAVFLHCLVTKYRWKLVKGGEIVRSPCLQFQNGFHDRFSGKVNENQEQASDPASYREKK